MALPRGKVLRLLGIITPTDHQEHKLKYTVNSNGKTTRQASSRTSSSSSNSPPKIPEITIGLSPFSLLPSPPIYSGKAPASGRYFYGTGGGGENGLDAKGDEQSLGVVVVDAKDDCFGAFDASSRAKIEESGEVSEKENQRLIPNPFPRERAQNPTRSIPINAAPTPTVATTRDDEYGVISGTSDQSPAAEEYQTPDTGTPTSHQSLEFLPFTNERSVWDLIKQTEKKLRDLQRDLDAELQSWDSTATDKEHEVTDCIVAAPHPTPLREIDPSHIGKTIATFELTPEEIELIPQYTKDKDEPTSRSSRRPSDGSDYSLRTPPTPHLHLPNVNVTLETLQKKRERMIKALLVARKSYRDNTPDYQDLEDRSSPYDTIKKRELEEQCAFRKHILGKAVVEYVSVEQEIETFLRGDHSAEGGGVSVGDTSEGEPFAGVYEPKIERRRGEGRGGGRDHCKVEPEMVPLQDEPNPFSLRDIGMTNIPLNRTRDVGARDRRKSLGYARPNSLSNTLSSYPGRIFSRSVDTLLNFDNRDTTGGNKDTPKIEFKQRKSHSRSQSLLRRIGRGNIEEYKARYRPVENVPAVIPSRQGDTTGQNTDFRPSFCPSDSDGFVVNKPTGRVSDKGPMRFDDININININLNLNLDAIKVVSKKVGNVKILPGLVKRWIGR